MMKQSDYIDKGVRVTRAYGNMSVGRVIFPPALLRDKLVQTGFCERIVDEEKPPEKAIFRKITKSDE